MAGKVEARRAALREALIDHAERRIEADGAKNLRARDLAKDAGCAVGAIYNVFGDLDDLLLSVNARTFKRLGAAVAQASSEAAEQETSPMSHDQKAKIAAAQLVAMSQTYHHFAAANFNLWRALFTIDRPTGENAPDWYHAELSRLFAFIDAPLNTLFPHYDAATRGLLTKSLFSSIHGIVLLGLDEASAGVPPPHLDKMMALVLGHIATPPPRT